MNLLFILSFIFINILIQHFFSLKVMSCNVISRIDSISYLYYKGIAFILTSNGYYYIINEEDVNREDVNEFEISGTIPHLTNCCDSALIKDIDECDNESDNEHSIAFLKHSSGSSDYISLNITSIFTEEKTKIWSKPKSLKTDIILPNINIDYSKRIDAIFHTDNSGELFFIQGEYYSGIEFGDRCPKRSDQISVYNRKKLSELNVFGRIDSAYYEPINREPNPILYLTNYDKSQYFKVEIDSNNSKEGKLVSLKTTTQPISTHPIFSKICAPNANKYNSSHLSAEDPLIEMSLNISNSVNYKPFLNIVLGFIFWYLIK